MFSLSLLNQISLPSILLLRLASMLFSSNEQFWVLQGKNRWLSIRSMPVRIFPQSEKHICSTCGCISGLTAKTIFPTSSLLLIFHKAALIACGSLFNKGSVVSITTTDTATKEGFLSPRWSFFGIRHVRLLNYDRPHYGA